MFFKKQNPVWDIRLELKMATFDDALAALSAKVDAILAVMASDSEALAVAREAVAEAEARAAAVVENDAAEDAAQDAARAASLNDVAAKLDAVLMPPPVVEAPVEEAPVEVPVEDEPVSEDRV